MNAHEIVLSIDEQYLDELDHVNYLNYVKMMAEAVFEDFRRKRNISLATLRDHYDFGFAVVELHAKYHRPLKLGDVVLARLETTVKTPARMEILVTLTRKGRLVAEVRTLFAAICYSTGRGCEIPPKILPLITVERGVPLLHGGMESLLGDRASYLKALDGFLEEQDGITEKIRLALKEGNGTLAHRLTHLFRNAAARVAATAAQTGAENLEAALKKNARPETVHLLIEELEKTIARMHAAMVRNRKAAAAAADASVDDPLPDRAKVTDVLRRLSALLEDSDSEAADLTASSSNLLRGALGEAAGDRLAQAMKRYDFEGAFSILVAGAAEAGYDVPAAALQTGDNP